MPERRVFRGRGGPTDRRLPRHNARRRKQPKPLLAGATIEVSDAAAVAVRPPSDEGISSMDNGWEEMPMDEDLNLDDDQDATFIDEETTDLRDQLVDDRQENRCFLEETNHLMCRMSRCRATMQLAATSIKIPENYERHVLGAVLNCSKEWKAILRRYDSAKLKVSCNTEAHVAATSLFGVIQHALQCGPLTGSKAGYWMRCGSEVAGKCYEFLEDIAPNVDVARTMHFTERQTETLLNWKLNAKKAMTTGEPPSKSTLERISQAEKDRLEAKRVTEKKKQKKSRSTNRGDERIPVDVT